MASVGVVTLGLRRETVIGGLISETRKPIGSLYDVAMSRYSDAVGKSIAYGIIECSEDTSTPRTASEYPSYSIAALRALPIDQQPHKRRSEASARDT